MASKNSMKQLSPKKVGKVKQKKSASTPVKKKGKEKTGKLSGKATKKQEEVVPVQTETRDAKRSRLDRRDT